MFLNNVLNQLIDRTAKIESLLLDPNDSILRKINTLEIKIDAIAASQIEINDLENRLIELEMRTTRQKENLRLREFVAFIEAYPWGWKGMFYSIIVFDATLLVVLEALPLKTILLKLLGLS